MGWVIVLGGGALASLTLGCVTWDYGRVDVEVPPDETLLASLVPGESSLQTCLEGLGAPLYVRELGEGSALAWGARRDGGWNLSTTVPTGEAIDASFRYSSVREGLRGVVLFFDEHWVLIGLERGWLTEILPDARPRPQSIGDSQETRQ